MLPSQILVADDQQTVTGTVAAVAIIEFFVLVLCFGACWQFVRYRQKARSRAQVIPGRSRVEMDDLIPGASSRPTLARSGGSGGQRPPMLSRGGRGGSGSGQVTWRRNSSRRSSVGTGDAVSYRSMPELPEVDEEEPQEAETEPHVVSLSMLSRLFSRGLRSKRHHASEIDLGSLVTGPDEQLPTDQLGEAQEGTSSGGNASRPRRLPPIGRGPEASIPRSLPPTRSGGARGPGANAEDDDAAAEKLAAEDRALPCFLLPSAGGGSSSQEQDLEILFEETSPPAHVEESAEDDRVVELISLPRGASSDSRANVLSKLVPTWGGQEEEEEVLDSSGAAASSSISVRLPSTPFASMNLKPRGCEPPR